MQDVITQKTLELAKSGNLHALTEIYNQYHVRVFRYLFYRTGDQKTAEDLSSEVFIKMLKALPGYEYRSKPFQAWLFQIARFIAIDNFRKNHRHQEVELDDSFPFKGEYVDQAVDRSLAAEAIYSALDNLPDDQRDVLIMRFILGLAISEVAETLNKSQDAIKGLQRRGLLTLRNRFTEMELIL